MLKFLRFILRLLFHFEAFNESVLKTRGPVLLLPNHVSWFDWLFLGVCLEEDWRFVTSSTTAQLSPVHRFLMINRRTFPVDPMSPYAARHMAEYLQAGGRLVLFPEGRISMTGYLMKFFDGTGFLLHKTNAKVITCHIRGAFRMLFSRNSETKQWFPRVSVHFSDVFTPPVLHNVSTSQARSRMTDWLRDRMTEQQFTVEMEHGPRTLPEAIVAASRVQPSKKILTDITGSVSYRRLVKGAALLAEKWQLLLRPDATRVGVLLPNVNATPPVLLSLWSLGKIPALLNFSTGPAIMLSSAQLSGLKQIITSRLFLSKARINMEPLLQAGIELIYMEDVRQSIHPLRKFIAMAGFIKLRLSPFWDPHATAVVLFTSGSEGVPKGVELSHSNLLANIRQMLAVCDVQEQDRLFNALPMFHSFGLTVATLLPLVKGCGVFLYPSPLHYRVIPSAVYLHNSTILLATNTFLNGYGRRAHPYDFRHLRLLFAGAEKVQESTATHWARKFGVRILEGYGATECSPVISVNTPMHPCQGSAGRLMPGIEYKLEPVEGISPSTGADPTGRLLVKGPNIMNGYINTDANAKFTALHGWYDTGDIVSVDAGGFVHIQGRLKRFAKISGEMVSLTAVEEALAGAFPQYGQRCEVAVISRPDPEKGEMLIAFSNEPKMTLMEIRSVLQQKGLPNLCAPRELRHVREIPKLGTGKVNHRELQNLLTA